jgi:hypothetical protein
VYETIEAEHGYAAQIQPRPTGCGWRVTSADGRTAHGHAPTAGSARQCCDLTITTLEALRRAARRRF